MTSPPKRGTICVGVACPETGARPRRPRPPSGAFASEGDVPVDSYSADVTRLHADLAALRDELRQQGLMSAVLDQRLRTLEHDVERLADHADRHYVSLARYQPVEKVLYGLVGLILVSFVGALVALVMRTS